ncbi:hypothetical protein BB561_005783 [Smittium simulii]|uniref:Nuclear distribution protein PAC1 n=1 Tax=Smittium simulii TaxID=133385 RepID=A0A2T9Y8A9_9FUNG|nr:hypothetical protein BB561_005783 [Smittium simulii]
MSLFGPVLTDRQKIELEKAILDFFSNQGYTESFNIFQKESNNQDFTSSQTDRYHNLLAKKWTSVIRLQKKIIELEKNNEELQKALKTSVLRYPSSQKSIEAIPKPPVKHILTQHRAPITRVKFHPQHAVLATASEDMTIKLWDAETGDFEKTLKGHTKTVHDISFDPKGIYLASCSSDLTIRIWDSQNDYKNTRTLFGHDHSVSSVCFLGSDKIVSASRDKTIKIWDFASGYCIKTITGHSEWVRYVSPSEDNKGHDNVVECAYTVPIVSYQYIRKLLNIDPKISINNASGQYVVSCSRDKTIKLWDNTGEAVYTFSGHDNWVRGLVFNSSGKYMISASDDKTMKIWDLSSGRCTKTIEAATHFVTTIDFCQFASIVATGSVDNTASIWNCK